MARANQKDGRARNGGKRAGAGRKPGAVTAKTRKAAEAATVAGHIPLDQMLFNMMRARQIADDYAAALKAACHAEGDRPPTLAELKAELDLRSHAQAAARDAAPFMHPRLNSIQHTGNLNITHEQALAMLK